MVLGTYLWSTAVGLFGMQVRHLLLQEGMSRNVDIPWEPEPLRVANVL